LLVLLSELFLYQIKDLHKVNHLWIKSFIFKISKYLALTVIGSICGFIFILIQLILIIDFAHRFVFSNFLIKSFKFSSFLFSVGMKNGLKKVKKVVKPIIMVWSSSQQHFTFYPLLLLYFSMFIMHQNLPVIWISFLLHWICYYA
jgi:hypothetical protein